MFCSKCGTQISASDQACPKCGAPNIHYNPPRDWMIALQKKRSSKNNEGPDRSHRKWLRVAVLASIIAVAAIGVILGTKLFGSGNPVERVAYSPDGLYAYIIDGQGAYFVSESGVHEFKGDVFFGQTTPDKSRCVLLYSDGRLVTLAEKDTNETEIASDAQQVRAVNNKGCFYMTGEKEHLWYYDFVSSKNIDVGFEGMSLIFSDGMESVIAINENREMSIFSCDGKQVQALCNLGEDDGVGICCVADNGSNAIWYRKNANELLIYTLKNGAPERIGKLINPGKYSSAYGCFFDDDQSFMVYSPGSGQILLSNRGELAEVSVPGVLGYEDIVSLSGLPIDSDDDKVAAFLLFVKKDRDSGKGAIYRMALDGGLTLEVEDAYLESSDLAGNDRPAVAGGYLYYLNNNHDFFRQKLGGESQPEAITTDVNAFSLSPSGKYAYIHKSGGLYYWETPDVSLQLNIIASSFWDDDIFFLSDRDDTIFYIQERKEKIEGTSTRTGTAYRAIIGEGPEQLKDEAIGMEYTGGKYICAGRPLLTTYKSMDDEDEVIKEFWLGTDGEWKAVFTGGKRSSAYARIKEEP